VSTPAAPAPEAIAKRPAHETGGAEPSLEVERPRFAPPRWAGPAAVLLVATILGLIEASQVQYDRAVQGAPISWNHALTHGLPRWYAWALLLPGIVRVTDAVRLRRLAWPTAAGIHAMGALLFTVLQVLIFSSVSTALHGGPGLVEHLRPAFLKYVGLTFLGGLVTYSVLVVGRNAWLLSRESRDRERESARLELRTAELKALLAEAQLGQLQSQLQPHFLFNALHTLNALIRSGEDEAAARMTRRMADFLRRSLALIGEPEIQVDRELELLDDYVEVQRARFGARLRVDVDVEDEARTALLPTLLLQPLVENAIRHGLERQAEAGRIRVSVGAKQNVLSIDVCDDGPGPARRTDPGVDGTGPGIGLENSRARLRELYGDAASLELSPGPEGGTRVRIRLPLRRLDVHPS
jgi:two-component system, LytTR family, sensor kinase